MAQKAWVWNEFSGGNASDRYVWPAGSFYDSKNVNVHDSPKEATLAKKWTQYGSTNGGGGAGASRDVVKILSIGSDTFQVNTDGTVFKNYTGGTIAGLVNPYGGNNYTFEDAIIFGDYVYIAALRSGSSRFAIFRDTVANWKSGTYSLTVDWAYFDYSTTSEAGASFGTRLFAYSGAQLLIARKNRIWSIAKASSVGASGTLDNLAPIQITLPYGSDISCVTQQSEYVRAYTNQGDLYLWGCSNLQPDYHQYLGLNVVRGATDFKNDYVMAGDSSASTVYRVVGFDSVPLARSSGEVNGALKFYTGDGRFGNAMAVANDMVYIPELNGVVVYGRKIDGLNKSIVRQWTFFDNEDTIVSCMGVVWSTLHVAFEKSSDSTHYVYTKTSLGDRFDSTDYYSTGYVTSRYFYGDGLFQRKSVSEIRVGYHLEATGGGSINVYLSKDGTNFSSAIPITKPSTDGFNITRGMIPAWYADFNQIMIKAELVRDNAAKTPRLREVTVIFEADVQNY